MAVVAEEVDSAPSQPCGPSSSAAQPVATQTPNDNNDIHRTQQAYLIEPSRNAVHAVHIDTLDTMAAWTTDETVKGVSFDADGFLWAVTYRDDEDPMSEAGAFKIDVETMSTLDVFTGLRDPYTYSDMTGNALGSVACAPEG